MSIEAQEKTKAAAALVASGVPLEHAANALGVPTSRVKNYLENAKETRIGIGNSPFTATANLIIRLVLDELEKRYGSPEAFGYVDDDEIDKAVKKAIGMVRQLSRWPDATDERIGRVLQNAADFVAGVLAKRSSDLPDSLLIKAGSAVAPFAAVHVDEESAKDLVIAEALVTRRPAQSDVEPELTARARRILQKASAETDTSTEAEPPTPTSDND